MENSSNTSLERLLIIHLAQWYQSGEFAPLDTKQQSARFVHTGRHIQTVLTVQGAIDAFSKPWLYKEGIRRASFFFSSYAEQSIWVRRRDDLSLYFLMQSCARIATGMTVPINVEMKIGCVFQDAPYPTSLRKQVTSPLEEAVLQVSFLHSLAEAVLMVCNCSDFFFCYVWPVYL
jgi:hypothetical protein